MAKIRLTKSGFTNYTGILIGVKFTNGVSEDTTLRKIDTIAANIGGDLVDTDGVTVIQPAGNIYRQQTTSQAPVVPRSESVLPAGSSSARIKTVTASTYTLTEADMGLLIDFTAGCVITVPAGLPSAFYASLRQGGNLQIQVTAGAGATVEEIDGKLMSEKRLAILTLVRFPDGKYQLMGRTV